MDVQDKLNSTNDVTLKVHRQVESANVEARRKAIRRWLSAPDPSTNYQNGRRNRHATTGTWFLKSENFVQWMSDDNSILWLHGKAGCGKTVLSSTIISEILLQREPTNAVSLAYFFFDFNDSAKQKSSQMLRSMISQLFERSSDALAHIESIFSACSDGQQQPDDDNLLQILQAVVRGTDQVYMVLDALDECTDLDELMAVVSKIENWKLPTLRLLVTSRWLTIIEETMKGLTNSERIIMIQSKLVDRDISDYVSENLRTNQKLNRWAKRPDIQEEIRSTLTEKSGGMCGST